MVTPSVLVSGSLAYDEILIYSGKIRDHLPSEYDSPLYLNLRAQGPFRTRGGCGGNVAYTLSLLQVPVILSSWLGNDGKEYLTSLEELGIDTSGVVFDNSSSTPAGILLVDSQGDQILFFGEPEQNLLWPMPSMDGLTLSVITAGVPERTVDIMRASRAAGVPYIIDPGKFIMDIPPEPLADGINGADSLVCNAYERDLLARRTGLSVDKISSMTGVLVITMGAEGVLIESRDGSAKKQEHVNAAKPEHLLDPNGAGDAFLAGYSFGRHQNYTPGWSARMGAVAASYAIETKGAQAHRFTIESFYERLIKNYGEPEKPLLS